MRRLVIALLLFSLAANTTLAQSGGLKITVIAGEDAVNILQQNTATAPIVEVRDRNNLPVAGASVVFLIDGRGASFAKGAKSLTVVTDAAGRATATGLNPNATGILRISATATYQGQTATVPITQMNIKSEKAVNNSSASSGRTVPVGKIIGIAGVVGVASAVGVFTLGREHDSTKETTTTTTPTATTSPTSTSTPTTTTTTPRANSAPVISAATATPAAGLVGVTPIAFDVQATDPDNDQLTYLWEFPDGSTSDQRAFSRVFQVGGVHNSRVTARDGTTSTSREFSFALKTLTGSWDMRPSLLDPNAPLSLKTTLTLTQNGNSISGRYLLSGSAGGPQDCPVVGTIRTINPQVVIDLPTCRVGTGVHYGEHWEFQLAPDADSLSGTATQVLPEEVRTFSLTIRRER